MDVTSYVPGFFPQLYRMETLSAITYILLHASVQLYMVPKMLLYDQSLSFAGTILSQLKHFIAIPWVVLYEGDDIVNFPGWYGFGRAE